MLAAAPPRVSLVAAARIVASGWVPAYAPPGALNVWFYSRGC